MERGNGMAEAERWLTIAAKLLAARDLYGARTFASRARESDPSYEGSSQILAIADTLVAGDTLVSHHPDWYAVLQLARATADQDLIATQYRKLLHLLNPIGNKLAFADQALKLVNNAWSVLSDPVRKSHYDNELQLIQNGQLDQLSANQPQTPNQQRGSHIQNEQRQPQTPHHQRQPQMPKQELQSETPKQVLQSETPNQKLQSETPNQPPQLQMPVRRSLRNKDSPAAAAEGPIPADPSQSALKIPSPEAEIRRKRPAPSRKRSIRTAAPTPEVRIQAESTPPALKIPTTEAQIRPKRSASSRRQPVLDAEPVPEASSFWTACPYCYVLFEYAKVYEECALRCQNCRRAFHGAVISPPPETATDDKDSYFCTWAFFPLGYSGDPKATGGSPNWTSAPATFARPLQEEPNPPTSMNFQPVKSGGVRPRKSAYPDPAHQDDWLLEFSDLSDDSVAGIEDDDDDWEQDGEFEEEEDYYDDWERGNERKRAKTGKGKAPVSRPPKKSQIERRITRTSNKVGGRTANSNVPSMPQEEGKLEARSANQYIPSVPQEEGKLVVVHALLADANKNLVAIRGKKKAAKDLGKLDLNVEFNNDVEEPARGSEENRAGNDNNNNNNNNMEGIGFFEGLDEFLSSLPILSVPGDDKFKAS